jgi:hypothetical protein
MVRQAQKEGQAKAASPEVARVASSIKMKDAKKFASTKHKGLPEKKMSKESVNEEGYDHYKDKMAVAGIDISSPKKKDATTMPRSDKKMKGQTAAQKAAKGKSALELVKDRIRKDGGKIMGEGANPYGKRAKVKMIIKSFAEKQRAKAGVTKEETLDEKKKGLWDNIHAKRKRGEAPAKKGDKDYPETLNVEGALEQHKAAHVKKKDNTGGLPLQVAAKNRRGQMQGVDEAKVDKGRSDYGKASIRNYRRSGPGHDDPGMFDPEGKRGKTIDKRREEHKARRGVKGAKVPAYKKEEVIKEVSKKTLGSYIKKASTQMATSAVKGDYDKTKKRQSGVLKATDKLTSEGVMGMIKRAAKVKAKKTTGRDAGAIAAKMMRDKQQNKYVGFLPANEGYKGTADLSHMQTPEQKKAADERLKKANEKSYKKTQKEGTSYGLYKGDGKASGAMKKYLDKKAKMLTKKREAQSSAAKNNPHFDSTQPSPSGRNKYEHVSFKNYFTEGNNTARMLHKSKTSVTGNVSADRGSDEKKNQASRKGLEKDLKKKGIGYKKGVGKYKYDSGETGTEVSYQTSKPDKMSKRRFGKTMRRLGRKHGQESVITKDKNKPARLHDTESKKPGKSINVGKSKGGSNPSGRGQTSGDKVRSGKLPNKSKKGAYHYG